MPRRAKGRSVGDPDAPPIAPKTAPDVSAIRAQLRALLDTTNDDGRKPFRAKCGVYCFYDFDGEPIYVGQTYEQLSGRIGRHLTNQRTDAVAMFVLDPFEVESVEVWPLWQYESDPNSSESRVARDVLERAVYDKAIRDSKFNAVLNEKQPPMVTSSDPLPMPFSGSIIPDEIRAERAHPDVRIARRASTIANLARVIRERGEVNPGLRQTLVVQARRLEHLAAARVEELRAHLPSKREGEQTGEESLSPDGGDGL